MTQHAYTLSAEGTATPLTVTHVLAAGEFGGAESQILGLLSAPKEAPVKWQVVTMYDGEFAARVRALGIPVHVLTSRTIPGDVRQLYQYLRKHPTQVIHTHGVRASIAGRLAGAQLEIPVVTTVHSDLFYDYASPPKRVVMMALEHFTRAWSNTVIAVSTPLAKTLLARGYSREQVVVIPNGIDDKQAAHAVAAAQEKPVRIREQLGLQPDALIIISVARLQAVKNLPVLIAAVAALKEVNGRPVHLLIVGDGPDREALTAQVAKVTVQEGTQRTHLLGKRTDVFALLLEADVFALPSQMEGMPISIIEAMACGLPVVASRVGGIPDLVMDDGPDVNGILVPAGNPDALSQALKCVLSNKLIRKTMGENARDRFLQQFTIMNLRNQTFQKYKNVTKRRTHQ